ncbi:hypothetical protein LXN10_11845 [Arcobacter sp. KX21116]|uniref:LptM family lipoprotein n=1 Tax=Arcobacter iocasae TaxID=2906515 RepID=UPI0035D4B630
MKKFILSLVSIFILIGLTGCGSSMYNYNVEPTPIKQGKAKYTLKDFNLTLEHGHGRNIQNKTFINENELKKSFEMFINQELEKQSLKGNEKDYKISVTMNYTRVYNYGGNALNKPQFYYTVYVYNTQDKLLASFAIPNSTTKYGYFKDIAVNLQIGTFQRKAEDEPEDIELISKTLVEELSKLGN